MVKKVAVLISGGGTNLQSIIDNQEDCMCRIELVISNRKNAYGLERAKLAGIKTAVIRNDDALIIKMLQELEIDLVVLAGYLAILSDAFIDKYKGRIINIHPALIPSFCGHGAYGIHVHEMALQRGVKVTGATVHYVSEVVDGGPIIVQEACAIDDLCTASEIQERVLQIEHRILPYAIKMFCKDRIVIEDERVKII